MPSTYHTTEGIVLKKTPYGEADFWVRVLTPDFGKIDLRARGARKRNAKLNAHLDFLDHVKVSFVKNGDRIPTITNSEKISEHHVLFLNSETLLEAAKVAQTIDILIPLDVKDKKLFLAAQNFFSERTTKSLEFIKNIILHEGYGGTFALPYDTQEFIINKWPRLKS